MAFQAQPNPLPPTSIHSTTSISPSAAEKFLAAFLERANGDPSYQPDSTLSAHGPVSANPDTALDPIIHSLKRVHAGLTGKRLGRDIVLERRLEEGEQRANAFTDGEDWGGERKRKRVSKGGKQDVEWQDLGSFEREQVDLVEGVEGEGDEDVGATVVEGDVGDDDASVIEITVDKEERKRKKKERRKAEQRARASAAS
ncbi:predicted protein [Uncinocarpus reesii 1704]|uniref:Uncharacterized protein n=1 Tax=Uncinocarpus reesii (strain UAMH 1704) TaxID=336963 RepID=C4JUG4_UNCRE|nr:uncharacterized protein UREG_04767 [Uncinocarpus reesii 1704]EEP79925.1 predicted protein [Uncinocarpus reesii 1704]